jgi:hypothetical protein
MSPEASGPIVHIVDGLLLGVSQSRKHPRGRFPSNFALGVDVSHGLAHLFEFSQNFGYEFGSGEAREVFLDPLIFDIYPKTKDPGHTNFDFSTLTANCRSSCIEISVIRKWFLEAKTGFAGTQLRFSGIL